MKKTIMSLQHLLAMFGATVLVPILTGFDPSVAIFCAGVGTLIFHFCTEGKVPVFLGSSFAFIPVILAAKEAFNGDLAYAQGGIMVAGLLYVTMSFIVKAVGVEKIKRYFPAQVTGAMIGVIGLNLLPTAFNMASENFVIAGITLAIALCINKFGKGFIKQLGILIAVFSGYGLCLAMGLVDVSTITQASLFEIPKFTLPKFDLQAIIIIAPVVIAVFMEHIGDMTTNGAVVGKNFIENPGLNKTLLGDGLATIVAGFLGGPANTTYGENTAVLAITKNYDPALLRRTAVLAIGLACIGKFGGFLQSIPGAVMGGISILLFSMITLVGFKTVKDSNCIESKSNLVIIATIMVIGLGTTYLSNKGIVIGIPITQSVTITGLSLAAIVGIVLNRVLNNKDFKEKDTKTTVSPQATTV
ncbi:MAG: uracil-xanthine permease family protein [Romboutsia sp.]|uniref:uracil-xanthine permease family protein n=1 Tax=Romboutsia sp. TaxID=1965302 RepID=UPI003F31C40E